MSTLPGALIGVKAHSKYTYVLGCILMPQNAPEPHARGRDGPVKENKECH